MVDVLPLRIFLASPGDLDDEREVVRACVAAHSASRTSVSNVGYDVVGWDRVRGTAGRGQEAINELIGESHFMVVLFKGKWGSEPGSPWGYTSGTEEELFTGLLELGQLEQPMRDIWVGFVADPDPAAEISELRRQIIDRHAALFESITDLHDLEVKLQDRLRSWEALAESKVPRHIDLVPSSGKDVLRAANLRIRGEKLVELGQPAAGRAELEEAAARGGPIEHLAFARFQRRHGDLPGALDSTQKAIEFFVAGGPLYSTLAADAFAAQARVLRSQGRVPDAVGRLEQALTLLVTNDAHAVLLRARIRDDLGLAYQQMGDGPAARRNFESALKDRRSAGRVIEVSQSLINLARLEVSDGDLVTGAELATEAAIKLSGTTPSSVHANVEVLLAQVRLRQGRGADGILHAETALAFNQQMANRRGEAISLLLLAQCHRAAGNHGKATTNARACVELNKAMGDDEGVSKAQWLLDNMTN